MKIIPNDVKIKRRENELLFILFFFFYIIGGILIKLNNNVRIHKFNISLIYLSRKDGD